MTKLQTQIDFEAKHYEKLLKEYMDELTKKLNSDAKFYDKVDYLQNVKDDINEFATKYFTLVNLTYLEDSEWH